MLNNSPHLRSADVASVTTDLNKAIPKTNKLFDPSDLGLLNDGTGAFNNFSKNMTTKESHNPLLLADIKAIDDTSDSLPTTTPMEINSPSNTFLNSTNHQREQSYLNAVVNTNGGGAALASVFLTRNKMSIDSNLNKLRQNINFNSLTGINQDPTNNNNNTIYNKNGSNFSTLISLKKISQKYCLNRRLHNQMWPQTILNTSTTITKTTSTSTRTSHSA